MRYLCGCISQLRLSPPLSFTIYTQYHRDLFLNNAFYSLKVSYMYTIYINHIHHYYLPPIPLRSWFILPPNFLSSFDLLLVNNTMSVISVVICTSMQGHQLECGQPTSNHVIQTELLFLPQEPLTANSFSYRGGASGPFPIHAIILTGLIFCRFWAHKSSCCVQLLYYVMKSVSHGSSRHSPGSCIPSA